MNIDEVELEEHTIQPIEYDDLDGEDSPIQPLPGGFAPVKFDTSSRRIRDLFSDYKDNMLNPSPSFQRGYVWDRQTASRLIESVLLNVPLPLIYTAETDDDEELVIDGQQRLRTFFGFLDGKFHGSDKKFSLGGLKIRSDLNGKTFVDLDKPTRKALTTYNIQIIKISHDSDPEVKFEIFERLNSGSVKLNAQELRNCIFRGETNKLINELADDNRFSELIGASQKKRMKDCELALRFCAFSHKTYLNYNGGMKRFLNDFMEDNRNLSKNAADSLRQKFKDSVDLSFSVFGENAYKRYSSGNERNPNGEWENTFNRSIFDIIMWGFSMYPKATIMAKKDRVKEEFIRLCSSNDEFIDTITQGTGDKARVLRRFEIWKATLDSIGVNDPAPRVFGFETKSKLFANSPKCQICNQQIEHIDDAEVDHIVAYSKGGLTTDENAQIAHRYCNRRKSANPA